MTHKIEISGVSKWFRRNGEEIATMRETSLAIEEGRFVSIIGPSGRGKSTLFNIIAGLMPPSTGKVTADGKDIVGTTGYVGYICKGHASALAHHPRQHHSGYGGPWRTLQRSRGEARP